MSLRKDSEFYVKGNGYQFYLHPCNRSPKACNNSQMTGCQIGSAVSNIFGIGHIDGNSMYGGPDTGNLTIKNDYVGDDKSIRISWLNVVCRDVEANFTYENESPLQTYIFTLYTRYGCLPSNDKSGGLSVGSVLVILFFVLLLIYLVGGVLFLKYVRKAEGIEVIPNVEFWKDLPSLIKDGILFTFRGLEIFIQFCMNASRTNEISLPRSVYFKVFFVAKNDLKCFILYIDSVFTR
ncbi:hypothetical protein Btru_027646 [Bulinus truncatus]|nr:hypothetical protein Btru_027646 [Bulinus truncatus]